MVLHQHFIYGIPISLYYAIGFYFVQLVIRKIILS